MGNGSEANSAGARLHSRQEWTAGGLLVATFLLNELLAVLRQPGFWYVTLRAGVLPVVATALLVVLAVRLARSGFRAIVRRLVLGVMAVAVLYF